MLSNPSAVIIRAWPPTYARLLRLLLVPTNDDLALLQWSADLPNPPTPFSYWYRLAILGDGPHAYEWQDKPQRLVYDLCRELERLAAQPQSPAASAKLCEQ